MSHSPEGPPLRLAIAGCGQISNQYGENIRHYSKLLEIAGATDLQLSRAEQFCEKFGGTVYKDYAALLEDETVDLVVDLALHHAHFELNARALNAGKHVYSEKPMALTHAQACELIRLAETRGKRLAAAPSTFLGEGVQTAAQFLSQNRLGTLRLVYGEVNWGQIERWIGSPAPYFSVGPLLDVGVYAITALVYLLGPVRRVTGWSRVLKSNRTGADGAPFQVTAPDFTTGLMEFENGAVCRVTTNYYVPAKAGSPFCHLRGLEFHGDEGSFLLDNYHDFDARCQFVPYCGTAEEVPLLRHPRSAMDRAVGLADLALAIQQNRPHRASAEQAAHVIEIMEGLQRSSDLVAPVDIHSSLPAPHYGLLL